MGTSLRSVLELAGYSLSDEDLEKVRIFLVDYLEEIDKLRELVLPDDIEPVTQFRMERWD
ncbi:MAG: hypothetical protein ACE5MM_00595 [Nitrospiraceae bacterium]